MRSTRGSRIYHTTENDIHNNNYFTVDILHSNRYNHWLSMQLCSRCHFDHVKDSTTFEPSTALMSYLVPFRIPTSLSKAILSDIARILRVDEAKLGKHRIELVSDVHEDRWLDVGCFKGVDYWGDGSFYFRLPGVRQFQAP